MATSIFPQISESPSLSWIVGAICLQIINIFLGLAMAFLQKRMQFRRVHLIIYLGVTVCLATFLITNGIHSKNSIWDYLVGLYFFILIPISRRWDIMVHALITIVGLTLLPLLILLQIF